MPLAHRLGTVYLSRREASGDRMCHGGMYNIYPTCYTK